MRPEIKIGLLAGAIVVVIIVFWWFKNDSDQKDSLPFDKPTVDASTSGNFRQAGDERSGGAATDRRAPARPAVGDTREAASQLSQTPATARRTSPPVSPHGEGAVPANNQTPGRTDPGSRFPTRGESGESTPRTAETAPGIATEPASARGTPTGEPTPASPEKTGVDETAPGQTAARTPPPAIRREGSETGAQERLFPERSALPSATAPEARTAPAPVTTPAPRETAMKTYKIKAGDYLITIAEAEYGNGDLWTAIKNANPGLDENRLRVGQEIRIPPKADAERFAVGGQPGTPLSSATPAARTPAATAPTQSDQPATGRATYVVEAGDTLRKIAKKALGDSNRWREIYELNRDKISTPDIVVIGIELKLPPAKRPANRRE